MFGVISLVFWSITLIVSIKYVIFILRADNDGEGGVMALAALPEARAHRRAKARRCVIGAGGARCRPVLRRQCDHPGDLGAVGGGGLEVTSPSWRWCCHRRWSSSRCCSSSSDGAPRVGALFGPIMLVWFAVIGVAGAAEVCVTRAFCAGLSPTYAVVFVVDHPVIAFIAMGAVVLAITGAEALYADMGHFGRAPIRRAWFAIVLPALTLNYLGQGALILRAPDGRANPFFLLLPDWARLPMVVLATVATVIASQAVISGAFSVSRQAMRLGFLPHLRIRQTSASEYGQIYVPAVNWSLFVAVLLVVFGSAPPTNLAAAYGVAVTGTFLITTTLFLVVARALWHWTTWQVVLFGVAFGSIELIFFAANLAKVSHGGWLTLLIAIIVFTALMTWRRGARAGHRPADEMEGPLLDFIDTLHAANSRGCRASLCSRTRTRRRRRWRCARTWRTTTSGTKES